MRRMKNLTNQHRPEPGDTPKPPDNLPPGDEPNPTPPTDGRYRYKGGRQATGGVPNPDDRDDRDSPGSFRGTADEDDDFDERDDAPWESEELNGELRNPL
jgi:hypothetical protein